MIGWVILVWVLLGLCNRFSVERWNRGLRVQLHGSPFSQSDWEWIDWFPRLEIVDADTGDEEQPTIQFLRHYAAHGKFLFLHWAIRWVSFRFEMTRAEHAMIQKYQPTYHYDKNGKRVLKPGDAPKIKQHAELLAQFTVPGRRIQPQ